MNIIYKNILCGVKMKTDIDSIIKRLREIRNINGNVEVYGITQNNIGKIKK